MTLETENFQIWMQFEENTSSATKVYEKYSAGACGVSRDYWKRRKAGRKEAGSQKPPSRAVYCEFDKEMRQICKF
ncbi:MAG TPA: hypothetical protein VHF05_01055 [Candidatus Paceibacterota bacterium]|jgi:hypothetical protein|nr:hypothetical protein [Candidatus Paceibacterota bacterium]